MESEVEVSCSLDRAESPRQLTGLGMHCVSGQRFKHSGPGLISPQEFNQWLPFRHDASLLPMKEDLALWLNNIMGVDLTADSLMDRLDNGVILCQLGHTLQDKMMQANNSKHFIRRVIHWRPDATSGSFFARDNTANFLYWCRKIGVDEAHLFESEDLGTGEDQTGPKELVKAKNASQRYGVEPPGLVKLEREIEREEAGLSPLSPRSPSFALSPSFSPLPPSPSPPPAPPTSSSPPPAPLSFSIVRPPEPEPAPVPKPPSPPPHVSPLPPPSPVTTSSSTQTPQFIPLSTTTTPPLLPATAPPAPRQIPVPRVSTAVTIKSPPATPNVTPSTTPRTSNKSTKRRSATTNLLDDIVRNIVEDPPCRCPTRFPVEKQPKGCYRIGEKVLYIRMLNERHVMVRVGGGWETFLGYLQKHDPCRGALGRSEVRVCRDRAKTAPLQMSPDSYMVVGAHYQNKK